MTEAAPNRTAPDEPASALARLREQRARMLRVRYAVLGAVMAFLWIGHKGEPAWVHAVRLLLVLLTITPLLALTRRYYARRSARKQPHPNAALYWLVSVRVLTVTVALGIGWLVGHLLAPHHNDPIRLIVLRGGLLAITIPMQIRFERRRQAAGIVRPLPVRSPLIIGAKLALVLVAFGAEWLLGKVTPNADLIVAVAVFAIVALLGPKAHRYLVGQRRRTPVSPSQAAEPLPASD